MKKNLILFFILIGIYFVATFVAGPFFAQGMPYASYTFGWLFRRSFMYTWLITALLLVVNRPFTAVFTTVGCFLGIVVGDLIGEMVIRIRLDEIEKLLASGQAIDNATQAIARTHYGILPIWFAFMILMMVTGNVLDRRIVNNTKEGYGEG